MDILNNTLFVNVREGGRFFKELSLLYVQSACSHCFQNKDAFMGENRGALLASFLSSPHGLVRRRRLQAGLSWEGERWAFGKCCVRE